MMCAALPSPARERLVRIAGMLGSQFPGERANAAEAATRLLEQYRLTWRDVLAPSPAPPPRPATAGGHRARAFAAMRHADRLSDWERRFLHSVAGWPGALSEKQRAALDRIERKIGA